MEQNLEENHQSRGSRVKLPLIASSFILDAPGICVSLPTRTDIVSVGSATFY